MSGAFGLFSAPGRSRAAQEAEEHGLGLVGAGVPHRDAGDSVGRHGLTEKLQPRGAGGLFPIAAGLPERGAADFDGQPERDGERADEFGIFPRLLAAQAVIEVQDGEAQVPRRGERGQQVQQADGISASRNGHAGVFARGQHAVALDGLDDALQKARH